MNELLNIISVIIVERRTKGFFDCPDPAGRGKGEGMRDLKRVAMQGAVKAFLVVRMVIVACVCLLIGVSARHLFDAYVERRFGRER